MLQNDIDKKRLSSLKCFQKKIGITFKDISLLNLAFTHSSYSKEFEPRIADNEKLEFLGDAVLELASSTFLYNKFESYSEGDLTKTRASIVCQDSLSKMAKNLKIGNLLLLSAGEDASGGRKRPSILEDAFEALIGAIYLDQGWFCAFDFICSQLILIIDKIHENNTNYKSELQELLQREPNHNIEYLQISVEGPDHLRLFKYAVKIDGKILGRGKGHSKKSAEQLAAKSALKKLTKCTDKIDNNQK